MLRSSELCCEETVRSVAQEYFKISVDGKSCFICRVESLTIESKFFSLRNVFLHERFSEKFKVKNEFAQFAFL